ncbi:MAG: hypothetical protein H6712_20945 [Myxococcales bacterium]|nr:hypothetical protein [Myxococcales bacterium]MCB9716342.1 hypothetical protein [Myxococcales bacterium]
MSVRWSIPSLALWSIAASAACTVESDDTNPFGTVPVSSAPPSNDTGDDDTGGTGSGSGGGNGSSGPGDESTDGGSTSSMTTDPTVTTGVTTMNGSTDDGGPTGMQPASGMYSACTVADDCDSLCITIQDDMGVVQGGFCSDYPCTNPAIDCDPSPGGTAVPACIGVEINGTPDTACYLDCTGGLSCAPPMVCTPIVGGLDLCV